MWVISTIVEKHNTEWNEEKLKAFHSLDAWCSLKARFVLWNWYHKQIIKLQAGARKSKQEEGSCSRQIRHVFLDTVISWDLYRAKRQQNAKFKCTSRQHLENGILPHIGAFRWHTEWVCVNNYVLTFNMWNSKHDKNLICYCLSATSVWFAIDNQRRSLLHVCHVHTQ